MPQIPDDIQAAVVSAYIDGVPVADICGTCGVGQRDLFRILDRHGVTRDRAPGAGRRRTPGTESAQTAKPRRAEPTTKSATTRSAARATVEQMLGRPLGPDERVWHRNGDTSDNRPTNLVVKKKR